MSNVLISNSLSTNTLDLGVSTAFGALGAALVSSPIGAAGGALFGFAAGAARAPLQWVSSKAFNLDSPLASQDAKTMAAVVEFFGRFAAAWGALLLSGISMTLGEVPIAVLGMHIAATVLKSLLPLFSINFLEGRAGVR